MDYSPFSPPLDLQFIAFQLSEILKYGLGFDCRELKFLSEVVDEVEIQEATDSPIIIDNDGNAHEYQRDLCWSLEDKQMLIDAVYNHSDIGKFVVIRRGYPYVKSMIKKGHTKGLAFHELVDGKQRLNAIAEFMMDGFKDSNGKFYSEFTEISKRQFRAYNKCTLALMTDPKPSEVKRAFLNVNYTGKPMSKEHIQFVKSINL